MGQTFANRGWDEREVKVRRKELLDVLKKNREEHIADYNECCKGYRAAALARLDEIFLEVKGKINSLKNGHTIQNVALHFGLPAPVSHEKAYNQIIRMMEMSVDDEIVLTAGQFGCFVMDDWEWKDEWVNSNTAYFGGIAAKWNKGGDV